MVFELAGKPAIVRLQEVFESLEGPRRRDAHRALHIGIAIDEHRSRFERGDFLVRNLVGADQQAGAIAIGDVVQEGQTVQFQLRDGKSASEDLHVLLAADRAKHRNPPLGALLFSCCGRGEGLFGHSHHDSKVVQERVGPIPVAGFFAAGSCTSGIEQESENYVSGTCLGQASYFGRRAGFAAAWRGTAETAGWTAAPQAMSE